MEVRRKAFIEAVEKIGRHVAGLSLLVALPGLVDVDFVGRRVEHDRLWREKTHHLQHVQRTQGVDLEIHAWDPQSGGHGHLSRQMGQRIGPTLFYQIGDGIGMTDVSLHETPTGSVVLLQPG